MMKAGFVSFIGRPNVGKSTLLNMLIGEKIAIMSPKSQTTRTTIQGIKTTDKGQMIILDTPGMHKPKDALGVFMNDLARGSAQGVDVVATLLPANEKIGPGDAYIFKQLAYFRENGIKVMAIVTKIDLVPQEKLFEKLAEVNEQFDFDEIIPVSAKKKDNLETLENLIFELLPESELLYPEDVSNTQSNHFVIQEFIREKILHLTEDELPHSIAVVIEQIEETDDKLTIDAAIIVDRKSQKGIVIGKQGSLIKEIRKQSERDLKRHFGKKTYVNLWVKVEEKWRTKQKHLQAFGYDKRDYE